MKRLTSCCLALLVLALCACSGSPKASPRPSPSGPEPNAWVVVTEAPIIDTASGKRAGTAYPGFGLALHNAENGKAEFSLTFMDDTGDKVKEVKTYSIDTSYMAKKYVEPQAVIEIISADMIRINPNAAIQNDKGEVLLRFTDAIGPFRYIQKTDKGYMFTIDINVVFVKAGDAVVIPMKTPKS